MDATPQAERAWKSRHRAGRLLPPCLALAFLATAAHGIPIPDVRGDQLLFFYDARDGHTSFVSLSNEAGSAVVLELASYPADLQAPVVETVTLGPGGNLVVDMASDFAGASDGRAGLLVVTPVSGVDDSRPVVPAAPLAGSFTIAGAQSGFGENAFARSVEPATTKAGTVIDGTTVRYEQLSPSILTIPSFFNPTMLDSPDVDGNRLVLVAFADGYQQDGAFRVAPPGAAVAVTPAFCSSSLGAVTGAALDVSGVVITDLQKLAGDTSLESSGSLYLAIATTTVNVFGLFSEASGIYSVGQRLPAADAIPACATPAPSPTPSPSPTPIVIPVCGNGIVEGAEMCDGSNLGPAVDCRGAIGGDACPGGGTLRCADDCQLDLGGCPPCTCDQDQDCYIDVDCGAVAPGCVRSGICEGGYCVTSQPTGDELVRICTENDPRDHKPRCR